MTEATAWLISDLAEEIERALAEGGAGDGRLVEGRATAVKASPERGNSSKIVMGTSCFAVRSHTGRRLATEALAPGTLRS